MAVFVLCLLGCADPASSQVFRGYSSNGSLEFKAQKDKRHEVVKGYYPNGQLEFVATYKKGKLDGVIREYYEDGMLKAEIPYDNGEREGTAKFYHDNGMLMCKVYFEDNEERRAKFYDREGHLTTSVDVDRSGIKLRLRGERRKLEDDQAEPPDTAAEDTEHTP